MNDELLMVLRALLATLATLSGTVMQQQQTLTDTIRAVEQAIAHATPPAPTPTVTVATAVELETALRAQPCGMTIRLLPGTVYVGHFVLAKACGALVTTLTTAGTIPPAETRITPAAAGTLGIIGSPDTAPAISTAAGASGYALVGIQVQESNRGYSSIAIGTNIETALAQFPADITLDRVLLLATGQQRRGIMAIGARVSVLNSYIAGIKYSGEDSQAIWANGPGPYTIRNNYLEGAGENILFGGADPKVPDLVPSDIVIQGNTLTKPIAWRGTAITVKNALELKNARRVSISDNLIEHVWQGGQDGYAVLVTPRNQGGTAPWTVVEDVLFERNTVRRAGGILNILGTDDERPSQTTARITIRHNEFSDYGPAYRTEGSGYALKIGQGAADVTVDHNTMISANAGGILGAYGAPLPRFTFTNNIVKQDRYGIFGDGTGSGLATLSRYFPGATVTRNAIGAGVSTFYPAGNLFPLLALFQQQFTDLAAWNLTLIQSSPWKGAGTDGADLGK